jgi:DNA polymerase type B, organellar and viral
MARRGKRGGRPVIHIHACRPALGLERAAYYGGRVDVFRLGLVEGPVYELDITGFYPSIMREHRYPCQLLGVESEPSIARVAGLTRSYTCAAHVRIRSGDRTYPYRDTLGSRLVCGEYVTSLCGEELVAAIEEGHVIAAYRVSWYRTADLFTEYVDRLWDLRKKAQSANNSNLALGYKLLANSLYGKWAQHAESWVVDETVRPAALWGSWSQWDADAGEPATYRSIGGRVERQIRDTDWINASPIIAGCVTSRGRERLRHIICTAGVDNTYYADTDAIHTDATGLAALQRAGEIADGRLGALRIVSISDSAEYRGRKHYRLGGECVTAGARFDPRSWVRGSTVADRQDRAGHTVQSGPVPCVMHRTVPIDYSRRHIRGAVLPDGRVLPEVVGDEQIEVATGAV